jgi:hypothetical protein
MRSTTGRPHARFADLVLFLTVGIVALPIAANAATTSAVGATRQAVPCPLSAAELSAIVGRNVQRVALGGGKAAVQCAFSAVEQGAAVNPQIYLTRAPGNATDLRSSYRYYLGARAQLATRPQVTLRPDIGPNAFTLTSGGGRITTAFFLSDGNIASLSLDLTDAPRQDKSTAAKLLALAVKRLPS